MNAVEVRGPSGSALAGIPSLRLADEGGGKAYFVPNEEQSRDRIPGIWYLFEAGRYESPTGQYMNVTVVRLLDWRVDVHVTPTPPEADAFEAYDDYFIVQAVDKQEAFRKADLAAYYDVLSRYGEQTYFKVRLVRGTLD